MDDYAISYVVEIEELDPCSKELKTQKKQIYFDSPEQAAAFVKVLIENEVRFTLNYEDLEAAHFIAKQMEEQECDKD